MDLLALFGRKLLQLFGLYRGPGISVEKVCSARIRPGSPVADYAVGDIVRDQLAGRHYRLDLSSQRRVQTFHLAEHVASRDLRDTSSFCQKTCLGPLTRSRGSDQYYDLFHISLIEEKQKTQRPENAKLWIRARCFDIFRISASQRFKLLCPSSAKPRTCAEEPLVVTHH